MTDGASQPPGWYYAQGDPPGTQRYWDGSQWQGGPQPVAGAGGPQGSAMAGSAAVADRGTRFVAFLIDWGLGFAIGIVGSLLAGIVGSVSDGLGTVVNLLANLAGIGFVIWNYIIRQGSTGQTIGKEKQNIKLLKLDTMQPPGGGMATARYFLGNILAAFCLIDLIWILIDKDNQRLSDKVVGMNVFRG